MTIRDILARRPEARDLIEGLCVVGVTHTFVLLDGALRPLAKALTHVRYQKRRERRTVG